MEFSVKEVIFDPAWIPVPLTVWPTVKPTVLLTLIKELTVVCDPVALATVSRKVVPAASWATPKVAGGPNTDGRFEP